MSAERAWSWSCELFKFCEISNFRTCGAMHDPSASVELHVSFSIELHLVHVRM